MSIAARGEVLADVAEVRGRSLWQDARRRLLRNRAAVVSMIVLARYSLDSSSTRISLSRLSSDGISERPKA